MSIFDFLRRNNDTPQIQAVIQEPIINSKTYPIPGMATEQPQGNGLFNKIRGKIGNGFNGVNLFDKYDNPTNEVNYTSTNENGDTVLNSTVGTPVLTQRGFLNDFSRGFKDNAYNGFKVENLQADKLNDMPKNFANRLGEAIGTAGRILNSPLGRGLITAGIVGATGGSGLEALAYGGQAGVTNQQLVNNDRMYRQALKDYGYNTDDIGGYVDKDTFNTLATNAYKQNSLKIKQDLATAKDNLSYMKILLGGLNNGTLSPEEVQLRLAERGLTLNDLREANNDKKVTIEYKGIPTHKTVDVRNTYEQKGGTGSKYGTGGAYVKIQAPDGTQATVPAEKANYYIQKGGN